MSGSGCDVGHTNWTVCTIWMQAPTPATLHGDNWAIMGDSSCIYAMGAQGLDNASGVMGYQNGRTSRPLSNGIS